MTTTTEPIRESVTCGICGQAISALFHEGCATEQGGALFETVETQA